MFKIHSQGGDDGRGEGGKEGGREGRGGRERGSGSHTTHTYVQVIESSCCTLKVCN